MNGHPSPAQAQWLERIHRHAASGLSAAEFCRRNGIAASSFFASKRRLGAAAAFVEAKVVDAGPSVAGPVGASASSPIDVRLRGGLRVRVRRGFDRALLAEVVAVLEAMS